MDIESQKISFFKRIILDFVRKAGREHLPWRRAGITAYEVWVSEVMLQQTQVSRVIGYYTRFLERFPTVEVLAEARWEEFLPYYAGLGYYARGRNMLAAARMVVSDFGGEFPRDKQALRQLPGVGDYTAAAILSFAYDEPYLAFDTNLKRVLGRFFFGSRKAFETMSQDPFERYFAQEAREMNAGLMDFGSSICVGRPKCAACPLASRCVYFSEAGKQEQVNVQSLTTKKKGDWREASVLVFLHEKHQKYFSADPKRYRPFRVPATQNTRSGIKDYFREHAGLELAVRPPHEKILLRDKPVLLVNAQILLGEPKFSIFGRDAVEVYLRTLKK